MTWKLLDPVTPKPNPCANCPDPTALLSMKRRIGVGFGRAGVSRDGVDIWAENGQDWEELLTVAEAEALAAADPDHDWRIELRGPLHGECYQRQGAKSWVCVDTDEGFAGSGEIEDVSFFREGR
jgi:hypothetical protein